MMLTWLRTLIATADPSTRMAYPFFLLLTLALGSFSGLLIAALPEPWPTSRLVLFIVLMVIHIALHWLSPFIMNASRQAIFNYLAFQGTLAFILVLISGEDTLSYALFLAVIGEAVSMLRKSAMVLVAVVSYLALSGLSVYLTGAWPAFEAWGLSLGPLTLFVVIYVLLFVRQNEARAQAQALAAELEVANRQLADYAAKIESLTLTAERQRMARELHDTLAQGLAGLILQLEAADSHLTTGRTEKAQAIIQQGMSHARASLRDARRVIDDLRTDADGAQEWITGIRQEAERFTRASGIPCEVQIEMLEPSSPDTGEHCLRIISEGLTNIARHAHATRARLNMVEQGEGCLITLEDDGCGFSVSETNQKPGHYGLLGMRERARMAGGTLTISSQPGAGTRIELRIPNTEKEN